MILVYFNSCLPVWMGYTACQFKRLRRGNLQIAPLELHRVPANDISKTSSAKVYPSFLHPYILMAFDRTELIRCGVAQQWNKYTGYSQGKECLLLVKAVPMSLFFKTGVPTSHGFLSFSTPFHKMFIFHVLNPEWIAATPNVRFSNVTMLKPACLIIEANVLWKYNGQVIILQFVPVCISLTSDQ